MERNLYVFLLISLSVLFQYIEIFKFSRIDVDTMDIKYEIINRGYSSFWSEYEFYFIE